VRDQDANGLAAAAFLVLLAFKLDEGNALLYSGGFAVTSLTSAVLIAAVVHPRTLVGRALGLKPLRWVGVRAYSLYLWHWPVFMLTRPHVDVPLDGLFLATLQIAATVALAELSYRFVEQPIRHGLLGRLRARISQLPRRPAWQQGATVTTTAALVAGFVALSATVASARAPEVPAYLAVPQISGVLTATPQATATASPAMAGDLGPDLEGDPEATATPSANAAASGSGQAGTTATPAPNSPASASTVGIPAGTASAEKPNESPFQSSVSSSSSTSSDIPPAPTPPPATGGVRATAIGDSVMLGAAYQMASVLGSVDVDAAVGRQMNVVLQILQYRKEQGLLADVVIVQVGNNGPITEDQFDEMMQLLSGVKQVLVLNVKVPLPWEGPNNQIIQAGTARYRNATFLDWHATSVNRPELFWSDNDHLRPEGAEVYVGLIASAIR
jgi:hypothetical protein